MPRLFFALLLALPLLGTAAVSPAAAGTVHVADGVTAVSYDDTLSGSNTRDYVLPAHDGQRLEVLLSAKSDDVYYRVYAPGGDGMYNSRSDGNHLSGLKIKRTGSYIVRVELKDVEKGHERHYSLIMRLK